MAGWDMSNSPHLKCAPRRLIRVIAEPVPIPPSRGVLGNTPITAGSGHPGQECNSLAFLGSLGLGLRQALWIGEL